LAGILLEIEGEEQDSGFAPFEEVADETLERGGLPNLARATQPVDRRFTEGHLGQERRVPNEGAFRQCSEVWVPFDLARRSPPRVRCAEEGIEPLRRHRSIGSTLKGPGAKGDQSTLFEGVEGRFSRRDSPPSASDLEAVRVADVRGCFTDALAEAQRHPGQHHADVQIRFVIGVSTCSGTERPESSVRLRLADPRREGANDLTVSRPRFSPGRGSIDTFKRQLDDMRSRRNGGNARRRTGAPTILVEAPC
jgi:hypothetical protein